MKREDGNCDDLCQYEYAGADSFGFEVLVDGGWAEVSFRSLFVRFIQELDARRSFAEYRHS